MKGCQRALHLTLLAVGCFAALLHSTHGAPSAEPEAAPAPEPRRHSKAVELSAEEPKFVVISEDVIPDVENTTQKVIRVNPLDLPAISDDPTGSVDSSLFKIQSLLPANRNYVNSNRMRRPRPHRRHDDDDDDQDSPIIRRLPEPKPQKPRHDKQKKLLHFLYDQEGFDGRVVSKTMRVHVAPGAYPVYYAVAKTNGRFGKQPIKGFRSPEEFRKYVLKRKLQPIELVQPVAQSV